MFERHVQRFANLPFGEEPHLTISDHLQIWAFGKTAAGMPGAARERTDGTWVRVVAVAYPEGVRIKQVFDIRLADIDRHMKACAQLLESGSGTVVFDALAPMWTVTIRSASDGKFTVETVIVPAGSTAPLRFSETFDGALLRMQSIECQDVLRRNPIEP